MSTHKQCPTHQCTCSEVQELSELYRELKCHRKRASSISSSKDNSANNLECNISSGGLQLTRNQAEHALGIVKKQRDGVRNLMNALRQFSQKLSKQEEMICQTDKEIAELREEMRRIKEQRNEKQHYDNCDSEEVQWRQAIDSEIREQCRLKNKIKRLSECLESRKQRECSIDAERQKERKTDAKLLLDAMDFVERCIPQDNVT